MNHVSLMCLLHKNTRLSSFPGYFSLVRRSIIILVLRPYIDPYIQVSKDCDRRGHFLIRGCTRTCFCFVELYKGYWYFMIDRLVLVWETELEIFGLSCSNKPEKIPPDVLRAYQEKIICQHLLAFCPAAAHNGAVKIVRCVRSVDKQLSV